MGLLRWMGGTAEVDGLRWMMAGGEQSETNLPELHELTVVPHSQYWCKPSD